MLVYGINIRTKHDINSMPGYFEHAPLSYSQTCCSGVKGCRKVLPASAVMRELNALAPEIIKVSLVF